MKQTFFELILYTLNPVLEKDTNRNQTYRFRVFFRILLICILLGIATTPLFSLFEYLGWINMESHKVEALFKDMPVFQIILLGAVVIPVIEELIFRAPITAFKKPKAFKIAFYIFSITFALIHITNFEITYSVLLLAPLLVLPQLIVGICLGFLRVKFGLQWSFLLHGTYNCFFILISLLPE